MVIFLRREVFGFEDCSVKFARVGCYRDSLINPRPIPELLMTDRDPTSHAYSGKPVDWKNWNEYLPDLVCRCAKKTRDKGYNVFGLQFYGECWSDFDGEDTYFRAGPSNRCVTHELHFCDSQERCDNHAKTSNNKETYYKTNTEEMLKSARNLTDQRLTKYKALHKNGLRIFPPRSSEDRRRRMKLSTSAFLVISLVLFVVLLCEVSGSERRRGYVRFGRSFTHDGNTGKITRARTISEDNSEWDNFARVNRNIEKNRPDASDVPNEQLLDEKWEK
ncbi:hypothetical protein ACROYT_G007389 [Oculina patagonica]